MPTLFSRLARRYAAFKLRYVGQKLWTGSAPSKGLSTAIRDASFTYEGGPEAVMLIHGLSGTPTEMRYVGKAIARQGYTVYGIQLAGHCGSENDLLHTDWKDWYASVEADFDRIAAKHETVFVGGLSLGAVLSFYLASKRPGKVKGIMLYSTTLWYDGWSIPLLSFLLPLFLYTPLGARYRFVENFPYGIKDERLRAKAVASMEAGDSAAAGNLGLTGRTLRELRRFLAVAKPTLGSITTPALILHASDDDITSVKNANFVAEQLGGPIRKVFLDDCYHMITVDRQRQDVVRESLDFMAQLTGGQAALCQAAQ